MDIVAPSVIPNLQECAILLDVDGTIVDLAPTPQRFGFRPHCGVFFLSCSNAPTAPSLLSAAARSATST